MTTAVHPILWPFDLRFCRGDTLGDWCFSDHLWAPLRVMPAVFWHAHPVYLSAGWWSRLADDLLLPILGPGGPWMIEHVGPVQGLRDPGAPVFPWRLYYKHMRS